MNIEEELEKAKTEMNNAEDALVQSGFSRAQWMLIKSYVLASISHGQLSVAQSLKEFGETKEL
jgi:hypothetical protein